MERDIKEPELITHSFPLELFEWNGTYTGEAIKNKDNNIDNYENLVPHGKGEILFNNGPLLKITAEFENGEINGILKRYLFNGMLEFEGNYKNNLKEGWCKLYLRYWKNPILNHKQFYVKDQIDTKKNYNFNNNNGKQKYKGTVDHKGQYRGFGVIYFPNGQIAFIGKLWTSDTLVWIGSHFQKNGIRKFPKKVVRRTMQFE